MVQYNCIFSIVMGPVWLYSCSLWNWRYPSSGQSLERLCHWPGLGIFFFGHLIPSFSRLLQRPMTVSVPFIHAFVDFFVSLKRQKIPHLLNVFKVQSLDYFNWNALKKKSLCNPLIKMYVRGERGYIENLHKIRWEKDRFVIGWLIYLSSIDIFIIDLYIKMYAYM